MDYWHEVARSLGGANYDRAWALNAAGRVTIVDLDADNTRTSVDAVVRDRGHGGDDVMVVSVVIEPARGSMSAYCSCEHAPHCAHVAAVLLAVSDAGTDSGARGPKGQSFPPRDSTPPWQRSLDGLLPASDAAAVELCLFITLQTPRATRWSRAPQQPRLAARPGMRGARSAWKRALGRLGTLPFLLPCRRFCRLAQF